MRRFLPLTAIVLALAAGSIAVAQQPGRPGLHPALTHARGPGFGGFGLLEFDANADGQVTKAELDAAQRARFDEIDANKDGVATREERQRAKGARVLEAAKARFAAMDADKNGQLSQDEYFSSPERFTPRSELVFQRELLRDMAIGMARFDRGEPDPPPGPGGPDADVSFAEFSARGTEAFTRADADKDGTVTIAELQTRARGPH